MHRLFNTAPAAHEPCMGCKATRECKQAIQHFISQKAMERLKELLPAIFDASQIYATDTQMQILRDCSLTPIRERNQVTFSLSAEPSRSNPPSSTTSPLSSSPLPTPSASSRSWPSSEANESD